MPGSLPRVSGETTEVGWITSKRYIPYEVASFAISLVTCWLFWFLLYAATTRMIGAPLWGYSPEDADFLTTGLGIYLASMVTPLFGLLWFLDEIEKATVDRNKVREFFGRKSWGEIVKLARRLKGFSQVPREDEFPPRIHFKHASATVAKDNILPQI